MASRSFAYFRLKESYKWQYPIFLACELLNLGMLIVNWIITDEYLGGRFHDYGVKVWKFWNRETETDNIIENPMCDAFPTLVIYFSPFLHDDISNFSNLGQLPNG